MTREELLDLMPKPRVDWENINEGHLLLITSESASEGVDYRWVLVRVARTNNDDTLVWGLPIAGDPKPPEGGLIPFNAAFDEQYWNLTEMSRQHLLPREITTFVMEYQDKL